MQQPVYKRILLKLSGESLAGPVKTGINPEITRKFSQEIKAAFDESVQIGVVIGGGNIFRGLSAKAAGIERVAADHMGMLATVINAISLQNAIEQAGIPTRILTAIEMNEIAEPFIRRRALRHLEKGRVVIFAAGTGNPYFTTDTAAALRAIEINADVVIKGTRVDGIYSADPEQTPDAKILKTLDYMDVIQQNLRVMDQTAITLCKENNLPILVFNMDIPGNLRRVVRGEKIGSLVSGGENA
ncbi:MAG: UMP kinase [Candidatus Marinimicrobia bacterium]|nr:UMP kinase [Candidatus Neomarinimicrobiota bacterium]MCF7840147.1 UMP kinase [Candidatus Neomarinimicrobiota bacterium]MCF7903485.1 UMP kinase [Candidatus Neomarinimicrobiota bacterium]